MRIRVEGGHPLGGQYQPSGNANAAIALMAASLLTSEESIIQNVPDTTTIRSMIAIAGRLGAILEYGEDKTLILKTEQITQRTISNNEMSEYVGALLYLAPILVRRQYARLEINFPLHRIRTHLEAMRDLGIDVVTSHQAVECRAATWEYKDIILSQTSVTATAIVMMLAACFGQETIVHNVASEPHVQELAHMLERMGAQVHGVGSNVVRVFGKPELHGVQVEVGPDHIETASIAAIAAVSGGRLQIEGTRRKDLRMIDKIYRRLGVQMDVDETAVFIPKHSELTLANREEDVDSSIETLPWPGFPSDLVAVATIIATQARGSALIHEKLFDNRLLFIDKLNAMGAQIVLCDPHRAIVVGPSPLSAIYMDSPDVRTGLGMLGAGLVAKGESIIDNAQALSRNFDGVIRKLQKVGAHITIESAL